MPADRRELADALALGGLASERQRGEREREQRVAATATPSSTAERSGLEAAAEPGSASTSHRRRCCSPRRRAGFDEHVCFIACSWPSTIQRMAGPPRKDVASEIASQHRRRQRQRRTADAKGHGGDDNTPPGANILGRWTGTTAPASHRPLEYSPRLYRAIVSLRERVFVVEQRCVYLDADGIDPACRHLFATRPSDHALAAYLRVVPAGERYAEGQHRPRPGRARRRAATASVKRADAPRSCVRPRAPR